MVITGGKNLELDPDLSEGELDGGRDDEGNVEPPQKGQRTKRAKTSKDDPAFNLGSPSSKGKEKATSGPNQLITRRNGRAGKLQDLMNMPVDIFTEVCSYLDPYDLRRLALTSKRLWDILMTKEARHIWKAAIAAIPNLPECPTDLNEPQYVFLLYSSECYTVGCTSRGTKVDWFHRVRFCKACHTENFRSYPSSHELGLNEATLSQIRSSFDSGPVMHLAQGYWRAPPYYIEAIKKAGRKYEALSQEQAGDYLSRLKLRSEYQVETGRDILRWKDRQTASRVDDIAAEKNARFESIKVKLFELGWDEKDFPMSNKEFKDLVLKNQKLTPKVWQNIRPKLESLLETRRNDRLEMERRQRRSQRDRAIWQFYYELGVEALKLPFTYSVLASLLPNEVFALPSIKVLLENDTETVTEEEWNEVVPEIRLLVLRWWRDCLQQLTVSLEDGATVSVENTGIRSRAPDLKAETVEAVSDSIEGLLAKLSYATSAFHGRDYQDAAATSPNNQDLVKQLLKDLDLDPETATFDSVEDQTENLLCTRCDESVAKYMSFDQMIDHFIENQRWFDNVTEAVRKSPDSSYPSLAVNSQLPKIVNDHDWIFRDALLVRQDDQKAREAVLKLQRVFRKEELREVNRYCLLCPTSYAPYFCPTRLIALHIRQKHDKEPDLEKDTTVELNFPRYRCPL